MWHRMLGTSSKHKGKQMRCEVHNIRQCLLKVCSNDSLFYGTVNLVLQYFILDLRKSAKP